MPPNVRILRYYYDGMMWSSLFVPWRGAKEDHIVKVSGIGGVMRLGRPDAVHGVWRVGGSKAVLGALLLLLVLFGVLFLGLACGSTEDSRMVESD